MTVKVGINGFGRIGRQVYKAIYENYQGVLDVEAINDLVPVETNAHLLKYDSTYGRFPGAVEVRDGDIYVDGAVLKSYAERDPNNLPWGALGVDVVLDCTGIFRDGPKLTAHLNAGAKKVLLSAPGKNIDGTFVLGVNEESYDPATQHIISNASCTTNCLAPAAKVLNDNFGIKRALMSTIHAFTNDQKILDVAHKDLRRARTAAANIIPTTTGAAKAVALVIPELQGKFDGMAMRVPTTDVSIVDFALQTTKPVSVDAINAAMKAAAESGPLKDVLAYTEEELVSTDYIGHPASSIFDATLTKVHGDHFAKVFSWYDNEWGFSCRMIDLAKLVAKKG